MQFLSGRMHTIYWDSKILALVTDRTFSLAKLFGRISIVQLGPNDRTFFLQNFLIDSLGEATCTVQLLSVQTSQEGIKCTKAKYKQHI